LYEAPHPREDHLQVVRVALEKEKASGAQNVLQTLRRWRSVAVGPYGVPATIPTGDLSYRKWF